MISKKKLYYILFAMIALVPLGLISNASAWGEWDNEYYQKILGFIPSGIKNTHGVKALMSDYSLKGANSIVGYYLSAIVGVVAVYAIFLLIVKFKSKKSL